MTRKVFYVFDCGCTLEKQNVVKIKGSQKCPSHPQSLLLERFSFCADCGVKIIQKKSKGEVPRRCSKHKKNIIKGMQKGMQKNLRKKKKLKLE